MFIHAVFHRPHTKPCSICSIFETARTRQWLVKQNVSTCRYNGMESSTNMVILDIKMLSGFVPDPQSLQSVSCCFFPSRKYSSSIVHVNCWCCSDVVIVPNIIFFTAQRCFASQSGWSEGRPCHCLLGGGKKNLHLQVINSAGTDLHSFFSSNSYHKTYQYFTPWILYKRSPCRTWSLP